MIVWILTHAAMALGFLSICRGVGALVLRRVSFDSNELRFAAGTALGYGILGQLMFVLAAFGAFTRTNVMVLFGAAAIAAGVAVMPGVRGGGERPSSRQPWTPLFLLSFIGSIPSFLIALYPPIGYDGTMYHFVYARYFAEKGSLFFAEALRFPVFPQMAEIHYAAARLLIGDHAMQITQWIALPVTAMAAAALVRQAGGGERASLFAAALWLGTPYAVYLCGSGYVDTSLTMFVTVGIACSTPALSGAFVGLAAATKYHGLFFIVALARRRSLALFLAMAALFAAPWYAHITRQTGNPLFPYWSGVFGRSEYGTQLDRSLGELVDHPFRIAADIPLRPPLVTVFRRAILDPLQRGVSPHSPVLVLLLPFVVAGAGIAPRLRRPLLVAAVYVLLVSPLDWRFMLVVVPLFAAAIAVCMERLLPARATVLATLIAIGPGFGWGTLLMLVKYGPMPHTHAQGEAFLAQRIDVYRAVRALGPVTVYVYAAPNMAYYCPGKCLGDSYGPYRYALVEPLLHDPPRLARRLRSFGATHLVIDRDFARFAPAPPFRRVYSDEKADAYMIE